ncbi:ATP-dependent DNA helicase RecQ [Candidatus Wirthbacteria bacterium CG2_30_54_11]|uniref:DNA helicase RecQ n=1 Tax=Candidatus Wirthbacteria bacterium CG2_30_54_11 TaxID=1817892 RepID=A0A1J5IK83_9BACT|nr:MAG: ATP-dependent DNA helicase RecQ [Candidatus Wirthbacteria bacterium CG2_30_54_11]
MLSLLKQYFGYDSFYPLQQEIITNVVAKKDTLAIMPTGGGKSLCYQLPAIRLPGLAVVISPLIALMKDQVDQLKMNGVEAELINSSLTAEEISGVQSAALTGQLKILYIAPERLGAYGFAEFLRLLPVSLIAIDEAHCISEWGHDFRPDYRQLRVLRDWFPTVPLIALTATATDRVRSDIITQLKLKEPAIFIASFDRPNLRYSVLPKKGMAASLLPLLDKYRGQSAILYCFSRKGTEELAHSLQQRGYKAAAYHGGLDSKTRTRVQDRFINDEIDIITATIAFGMGIDKSNVRLVVHCDLPKSVEGYYQETGRAGRDGLPADCVLFFSHGDRRKHAYFIDELKDEQERKQAWDKLEEVLKYGDLSTCRRAYLLGHFGEETAKENCAGCDVCLGQVTVEDATDITRIILTAVLQTGERFGMGYLASVLLGKPSDRIASSRHDRLPSFGALQGHKTAELNAVMRKLISLGLLKQSPGEYPVVLMTPKGHQFLDQKETIDLPSVLRSTGGRTKKLSAEDENFDQGLFDRLRSLRKELADRRGVPPYVIFGDRTLREMAVYYPQSEGSLLTIYGVGAQKWEQFGADFLTIIRKYAAETGVVEVKKGFIPKITRRLLGSTFGQTKELLTQGLTSAQIARKRGLAEGTILSHLEKLLEQEPKLPIDHLKPPSDNLRAIGEAFQKTGGWAMAPVKEILGEAYSYDEIRLARIFLTRE